MSLGRKSKVKPTRLSEEERARRSEASRAASAEVRARKARSAKWRPLKYLVITALILVIGRVALGMAIPWVLDSYAKRAGLRARYDSMWLSLLVGRVELSGFELFARSEDEEQDLKAEPVARLAALEADLDISRLLLGSFVVHRAEVDGLHMTLDREASGAIKLGPAVLHDPARVDEVEAEPEVAEEDPDVRAFNFSPALACTLLRVGDVRVHWRDAVVAPDYALDLRLDARVEDYGSDEAPTKIRLAAAIDDALASARVEATLREARGARLQADLSLELDGFRPEKLRVLLAQMGLDADADEYDAALHAKIDLDVHESEVRSREGEEVGPDRGADVLSGELLVDELWLRSDAAQPMRAERILVPIARLSPSALALQDCDIDGLHVEVVRLPDARVALGGLAAKPAPQTAEAVAVEGGAPFAFSLRKVDLAGARVVFDDQSVAPVAHLDLEASELHVEELATGKATHVGLRLRARDVVRDLRLDADYDDAARTVRAKFAAAGLRPDALEPYLRALGVEHELSDQTKFDAVLEADWAEDGKANVALRDVALVDSRDLLRFDKVIVRGLHSAEALEIDEIDLAGHPVLLRRDAEGRVHACGFAVTDSKSQRASAGEGQGAGQSDPAKAKIAKTGTVGQAAALPSVRIGKATVRGVALHVLDEAVSPAKDFRLEELKLDAKDFGFGPAAPRTDGSCELTCRVTGLAQRVRASIRSQLSRAPWRVDGDFAIEGFDGPALDAYLVPLGLAVEAKTAKLEAQFKSSWEAGPDSWRANGHVEALRFSNSEKVYASCDKIAFASLAASPQGFELGTWTVDAPRVHVRRAASDVLTIAGVRLGTGAEGGAEGGAEDAAAGDKAGAARGRDAELAKSERASTPWSLTSVELRDGLFDWYDARTTVPVRAALHFSAELGALSSPSSAGGRAATARPTPFVVDAKIDDSLESLNLQGDFSLAPDFALRARLEGDGIRGGATLRAYLPAEIVPVAKAGRLRAACEARVAANAAGFDVQLKEIDYREAGAKLPWLALPRGRFALRQDDEAVVIEEAALEGLEYEARIDANGALRTLGMRIEAKESKANPEDAPPAVTDDAAATKIRRIDVRKMQVEFARLSYADERLEGEALELSCTLRPAGPFTLVQEDAASLPPFVFQVKGALAPFMRAFEGRLQCSPYASEPELDFALDLRGFRGDGFMRYAPKGGVDSAPLEAASAKLRAKAKFKIRRRAPTQFPLADGFGLQAEFTELSLLAADRETVLASVDRIEAEIPRILPRNGDVHIKELRITKPRATLAVDADALEFAGIRLLDSVPSDAAAAAKSAPKKNSGGAAKADPPVKHSGGDLRVDLFAVDGIDFAFEDRTAKPQLRAPIEALDLEVKGFTTRALRERLPIKFHVFAEGGKIALPERVDSGLMGGVLGAVAGVIGGEKDSFEMQQRPFFGELAVQGRVVMHPKPEGFIKTSIDSLELPALRGLAKKAGFEIGDGVLDTGLNLRFLGAKGVEVDTRSTFTYLSLDEPPSGPISTYLKLPAPLDTVLFVLKNENGEHVVPFSFTIPPDGMGAASIVGAAVSSFVQIVAKAIAASPFRIVGGVVSLVDSGDEDKDEGLPAPTVDFDVADPLLTRARTAGVEAAIRALEGDETFVVRLEHRFVAADFERAEKLANPSADEARALARRLRVKKLALLGRRRTAQSELRAQSGLGRASVADAAREQLTRIERELTSTEAALDRIYDLLRRGAERRRAGRTKRFALEIAKQRQESVRRALLARGVPDTRIEVRRPKLVLAEGSDLARVILQIKKRPQ